MSEPTRYTACGDEVVMADSAGPLVKWEDYQRLDALCKQLMAQHSDISCENIRLRKAGDAMASSIQFKEEMEQDYEGPTYVRKCVKDWNAAKEASQA